MHHRDPFDRMLIAQAQAEGLVLVTGDGSYPALRHTHDGAGLVAAVGLAYMSQYANPMPHGDAKTGT